MISKEEFQGRPTRGNWYEIPLENEEDKVLFYKNIGNILFVASISRIDWRAYIGCCHLSDYREGVMPVFANGTKLMSKDAKHMFPQIAEWGEEVGLNYERGL
jgi:hypothetical protein